HELADARLAAHLQCNENAQQLREGTHVQMGAARFTRESASCSWTHLMQKQLLTPNSFFLPNELPIVRQLQRTSQLSVLLLLNQLHRQHPPYPQAPVPMTASSKCSIRAP